MAAQSGAALLSSADGEGEGEAASFLQGLSGSTAAGTASMITGLATWTGWTTATI